MKPLKTEFTKKGFSYKQIEARPQGFIYEVDAQGHWFYEVFQHKINLRYDCISYPRDEAFGIWAWTYPTLEKAKQKLNEIISRTVRRNIQQEV